MSTNEPFARRSLDLLKPSGERIAVRVEFGPIQTDGGGSHCCMQFHGWNKSQTQVHGRDSLDALLQAIGVAHGILHEFVSRGGRVLWPGTDADYDLVHFVSSPEWRKSSEQA